jgi:hypothetical protein
MENGSKAERATHLLDDAIQADARLHMACMAGLQPLLSQCMRADLWRGMRVVRGLIWPEHGRRRWHLSIVSSAKKGILMIHQPRAGACSAGCTYSLCHRFQLLQVSCHVCIQSHDAHRNVSRGTWTRERVDLDVSGLWGVYGVDRERAIEKGRGREWHQHDSNSSVSGSRDAVVQITNRPQRGAIETQARLLPPPPPPQDTIRP